MFDRVPDTIDIPARASRCLDSMIEMSDRKHDCVPYIGASLGEDKPHFVHHRLDFTEVLPYSIYGTIVARHLSGSGNGTDVERRQRELMLSLFDPADGFVYTKLSPWNEKTAPVSIWEQARMLYALLYLYQDTRDPSLLTRMDRMVDSLFSISQKDGKQRRYSDAIVHDSIMGIWGIGALIDPLVKYAEMVGSFKALDLAGGIVHLFLDPSKNLLDGNRSFGPMFRAVTAVINGVSRYASSTGGEELILKAKAVHDYAVSRCTSFGSTPCHEPACSNMELNMSAISLARAGFDQYYDQIDRFTRNQTCEAQFLDPREWVKEKTHRGRILTPEFVYEDYPPALEVLPWDDYHNIVERSVGGFMWCSPVKHKFMPASVMLCCCAHAMRTFQIIWENALRRQLNQVDVLFHYNVQNAVGQLISCEPFEGRVSVVLADNADRLRIRLPEYARGERVSLFLDNKPVEFTSEGRFVCLDRVARGVVVTLQYPLQPRVTVEKDYRETPKTDEAPDASGPFTVTWKGNTVMSISPQPQIENRIYKREHLDTDIVPWRPARGPQDYGLSW